MPRRAPLTFYLLFFAVNLNTKGCKLISTEAETENTQQKNKLSYDALKTEQFQSQSFIPGQIDDSLNSQQPLNQKSFHDKEREDKAWIASHLPEHLEFIISLLPRIEQNAREIIERGFASEYSYGDFFHVHIRYPVAYNGKIKNSNEALLDPLFFHLQFHSFEYPNILFLEWVNQLKSANIAGLEGWINSWFQSWDAVSKKNYSAGKKLPLPQNLETIARSWQAFLINNYDPDSVQELVTLINRLYVLDGASNPNYNAALRALTENRSVVSSQDIFPEASMKAIKSPDNFFLYPIKGLNIPTYYQVVRIDFAPIKASMPLISVFETAHVKVIYNPYFIEQHKLNFALNADNQSLMNQFQDEIEKVNEKHFLKELNSDSYIAFAYLNELMFAIRYDL